MCQETLERASQPKKKPYISPRNSCSDAITRHSISHLVWTLRIGKDIPSLLMWRCHCEATAWRVTSPSPWNMSLCSLFHPTLMLFSIFDSTVSTLGLSRTPLWSAVLMKMSQEILLNIPSQLLCHKHWSRGKCPSADSGKHPYAVRTESFSCLCILNIWECLPLSNFKYFLLSRWDFLQATKHRNSSRQRKRALQVILKVFIWFSNMQWNLKTVYCLAVLTWLLSSGKSLSGRYPNDFITSTLIILIQSFLHSENLWFWKNRITLPTDRGKNPPFFVIFNVLKLHKWGNLTFSEERWW